GERIDRPEDFPHAFRRLGEKMDIFLMAADPLAYSMENVAWLEARCLQDRLLCLAPSRNAAKLGILLAVDVDSEGIGDQAAALVSRILDHGENPAAIGVVPPLGTRLILNMRTAQRIGLPVQSQLLSVVSEVIAP
ncbi:MAG: ABC transporter substrate binding protein, partial [Thermodesulfobacteriota bacterium]